MKPKQEDLFLAYMSVNHKGKENIIKSKEIQKRLGLCSAKIRELTNNLRSKGYPICSNGHGYWYARNEEEIQETINQLKSRITYLEYAITGLEIAKM